MRVVGAMLRTAKALIGLGCVTLSTTCAAPQRGAPWAMTTITSGEIDPLRTLRGDDAGERAVVVVVLDGARWQEIFNGVDPALAAATPGAIDPSPPMPRLRRLAEARGVALGAPGQGAIVRATGPNFVSLPGYTELFTGRAPRDCQTNGCGRTQVPTVADELRARARSPREVAVFSSWPDIERAASVAPRELVLSTGRHVRYNEPILRQDAEIANLLDGASNANPWPGCDDFRPDRFTAALALHYLEAERPRFLFLGLGEPDEYAHRGDYPGYVESLRKSDAVIDELVHTLDRMGERGRRTEVFITADHGRSTGFRDHGGDYPESARVWLIGIGGGIAPRGAIYGDAERRLADVAPTIRASFGLPAAPGAESGRVIDALLPTATP